VVIGVASGKGGTGKTTVAVNLAAVLIRDEGEVNYLDCDVEEPNGYLFLRPEIKEKERVDLLVPTVDESVCNDCGNCREICNFNAIVPMGGGKVLVFPDLCHGCGGCSMVCRVNAITETPMEIGYVESGEAEGIGFTQGRLTVGRLMPVPVIRKVRSKVNGKGISIVDSPPGTSCPVVESLRGVDKVILVTEPTPFGLYDLRLAVDMVRGLQVPFGVVINRSDIGDDRVERYCRDQDIPVFLKIPEDAAVAEAYAQGNLAVDVLPGYSREYDKLINQLGL